MTGRRASLAAMAAIAACVVFRSALFLVWDQVLFDSDEAVWGLMGKHIAEGRAFPVFMYGQRYMLSVEAWLAAPAFLVAGVSVASLRIPMLVMNIVVALLLFRLLERDAGLRPWQAFVPTLFFALVSPGTAGHFVQTSGGTLEPLLYVLLLWATRMRPTLAGVIFAIGFLHREFTLYGLVALLAIEARDRSLFTREGLLRKLVMLRAAVGIYLLVEYLRDRSPGMGPGTTSAGVQSGHTSVVDLVTRVCFDVNALASGGWRIITEHWPSLFGVRVQPVSDFGIESQVWQGIPGGWIVLALAMGLALAVVGARLARERRWRREYDVCAYLVGVGLLSVAGFVVGRCGDVRVMRYEMLSILGAAGLGAWFLAAEPGRAVRRAWIVIVLACVAIPSVATARVLAEYASALPAVTKKHIARELEARGVRYARANYWLAYALTFLTNERVIVASEDFVRIEEYQKAVEAHHGEAFRISREPCEGGRVLSGNLYLCPPQ
jgi:hypothetical protein